MPVAFRYELPEILKIGRLRNRVMLCSMEDIVTKDGEMSLSREGIRETWAQIIDRRGQLTGPEGYIIREPTERVSHWITIRYMWDLDIRSTAWIYERRLKSPPRWFKILEITDHRLAYMFGVRQVERGDDATSPVEASPFSPTNQPSSVRW